jgi:AraC-like DNA-binding protein
MSVNRNVTVPDGAPIASRVCHLREASGRTYAVEPGIRGPGHYVEWAVPLPVQRFLACSWTGGLGSGSPGAREPVLPDGCIDIIWDGERLSVAGPDTRPNPASVAGPFAVGVRFQPGMGSRFLGVPAHELRDQRVALEGLWREAGAIEDEVAACSTLRRAAAVLEDAVLGRVLAIKEPDPLVEAAVGRWRRGSATADVAGLAAGAAITERQLHRRFVEGVGYGPKLLQRVLRFQAFLALCGSRDAGLAELAFRAGYADQAHLTREAHILAGRTPAQLRAARLGVGLGVRNVQDR